MTENFDILNTAVSLLIRAVLLAARFSARVRGGSRERLAATTEKTEEKPEACSIPAWYPNHLWSVDTTKVRCWGLWTIHARAADR